MTVEKAEGKALGLGIEAVEGKAVVDKVSPGGLIEASRRRSFCCDSGRGKVCRCFFVFRAFVVGLNPNTPRPSYCLISPVLFESQSQSPPKRSTNIENIVLKLLK